MASNQAYDNVPAGAEPNNDSDYAKTTGNDPIPVQRDDANIESGVNPPTEFEGGENSDAQLEKDDKDAIDSSNIINDRTRGAAQKSGTYREPGDEEVSFT